MQHEPETLDGPRRAAALSKQKESGMNWNILYASDALYATTRQSVTLPAWPPSGRDPGARVCSRKKGVRRWA
jgi:hypothetical protein